MARIVTGGLTTFNLGIHLDPQTLDLFSLRELISTPAYTAGVAFPAYTAANVALTIDANRQMALRSTPAGWSNAVIALDLNDGALVSDGGAFYLTQNTYFNVTFKAKATGEGASLRVSNGRMSFASAPSVAANATQAFVDCFTAARTGFGYAAGIGSSATQATSKSTNVTINAPTGQITMNAASLAAGASVSFGVINSTVAAADCVVVSSGAFGVNYRVEVFGVTAGRFDIRVTNLSGSPLAEALIINFALIKGATA